MKLQTLRARLKPQNICIVSQSSKVIFIASTESTVFDDYDIKSLKIDKYGVINIEIKDGRTWQET